MALTFSRAEVYAFATDYRADVFNFVGYTAEETATIRRKLKGAQVTIAEQGGLTQKQMEDVAMVMETYSAAKGRAPRKGSQTTKKPAGWRGRGGRAPRNQKEPGPDGPAAGAKPGAEPEPGDLAADAKAIADGLESVWGDVAALSHEAEEARKAFQAGDVAKVVLQDPALIEEAAARLTALAALQSELIASAAAKHPGELTLDMDGPASKRARTE